MKFGNNKLTFDDATELTIASDAITITHAAHKLQPASSTADDLSTINGTSAGEFGVLYVSDFGTDTITIKHNVGNILCMGGIDISLSYGGVAWYSNGTKVFCLGGGGGGITASETVTLTNKRITKRAGTVTTHATPTINTDNVDYFSITALGEAITSMTTNLSGTPSIGDTLTISILDNAAARAITWGASFVASTIPLPTTTVISTELTCHFMRNQANNKWRLVGKA